MQQMLLGVGAKADPIYVDNVFSLYIHGSENMGSSAADISVNNGIDLATDGGLVWIKRYENGDKHILADTENGGNKYLSTNSNLGVTTDSNMFKTFNSNGFTVGTEDPVNKWDNNPEDMGRYVSYTWKKTAGFFDVVKYQGNSGTAFNVSHSLGVKPGAILIKSLDSSGDWYWWSKGMTTSQWLKFNKKETVQTSSAYQIGANLTSTTFQVPTGSEVNNGSDNFIAYLWADGDESAAQIFGEGGDKPLAKMGTYTGSPSSVTNNVNIGFEPQWLIIRRFDAGEAENWEMVDSMRGWSDVNSNFLQANTIRQGANESSKVRLTPTGFEWLSGGSDWNQENGVYLYMAFRRPDGYVGKPRTATELFAMDTGAGNSNIPNFDSNFPVDFGFLRQPATSQDWFASARLIQGAYLKVNDTDDETTYGNYTFDSSVGWVKNSVYNSNYQSWHWRRHKGFECQVYTGLSTNGTRSHNMNTTPEMIWVKNRDETDGWAVFHKDLDTYPQDKYLRLDTTDNTISSSQWYLPPTSTHWYTAIGGLVNVDGENYIAMLFASVSGISSVGSYSGSNSSQEITLGFQPRFIIIKNIDDDRNWQVLDTTRGWGSGNDCRLFIDLTESQICTSEVGAPTSTGFTLTGGNQRWSIAGDNYIYYAHA